MNRRKYMFEKKYQTDIALLRNLVKVSILLTLVYVIARNQI